MKAPHEPATMQDLHDSEARVLNLISQMAQVQLRSEERFEMMAVRMEQLAGRMDQLTARMDDLAQAQIQTDMRFRETDAKLNALISVVDDLVRRTSPPPPPRNA